MPHLLEAYPEITEGGLILWKRVHPLTNKAILGIGKRHIKIDTHKIPI